MFPPCVYSSPKDRLSYFPLEHPTQMSNFTKKISIATQNVGQELLSLEIFPSFQFGTPTKLQKKMFRRRCNLFCDITNCNFSFFNRSLLLCIALSFHSIFEGLAIGLQKDIGELISLFWAVIAHKAVMAFSLGLTLAQARYDFK